MGLRNKSPRQPNQTGQESQDQQPDDQASAVSMGVLTSSTTPRCIVLPCTLCNAEDQLDVADRDPIAVQQRALQNGAPPNCDTMGRREIADPEPIAAALEHGVTA